ncbi:hypothetical protein [Ferruginibacter albus]|uniref:hypothetical protein n=1 Tax=Ferruginibacter albus TaxID=2875540 RepID=UPI001CC681C9|nr:hypothetical protein [Ferruginibacter albus]UAY50644.1 hypothetical protein K9M53_08560 [Ferruginibacter albus]
MKKIICATAMLFLCFYGNAQVISSPLPTPAFCNALAKIVLDFRSNFHNVQLDSVVLGEYDHDVYGASVKLPGAIDNTILRFRSVEDTTASYQSLFYNGESQTDAIKSYKHCVQMLKKSLIKWYDRSLITFKGKLEEPDPNLSFTESTLRLKTVTDERYKNFCASVVLTGDMNGWKVYINFEYKNADTDPEDDGDTKD